MNRIRLAAATVGVLAAAGAALLAPAATAKPLYNSTTAQCVDGTWGKDQWGNTYYCSGGKWVLVAMPAVHGGAYAR